MEFSFKLDLISKRDALYMRFTINEWLRWIEIEVDQHDDTERDQNNQSQLNRRLLWVKSMGKRWNQQKFINHLIFENAKLPSIKQLINFKQSLLLIIFKSLRIYDTNSEIRKTQSFLEYQSQETLKYQDFKPEYENLNFNLKQKRRRIKDFDLSLKLDL